MKSTRRDFMKAAALTGVGYWAMAGNASKAQPLANDKMRLAGFGVGGKGDSDISSGAKHCEVVVICDVDRKKLAEAQQKYPKAKAFTDYRKAFDEMEKDFDVVTVSTPDHTHACIGLRALRAKKHAYVQKPLTRTLYEARLMGQVAKEMGVCTQMGNQGSGSNGLRKGAAQVKAGVLGTVQAVHVWTNRPVWTQRPDRRETLDKYAASVAGRQEAEKLVADKKAELDQHLENLDWENWLGPAPERPFWPGLYHSFQWRGWWDFGCGALGDMACHTANLPYAACDLKFPTSVVARSSGHDFDSYPARSEIVFEFPATANRPAIKFYWYDGGCTPPPELLTKYGVTARRGDNGRPPNQGSLIIGDKGAMFAGEYGGDWNIFNNDGEPLESLPDNQYTFVANPAGDGQHDGEFYRAVRENKPQDCYSNFGDYAGPLTETFLIGGLAVWTAPTGAAGGGRGAASLGEWGEKVEWDAKGLKVTNLASLKTPGVAELIKPVYRGAHKLD
jgi:predicted dehydrogenase